MQTTTPYALVSAAEQVREATKRELVAVTRRLERAALDAPPPAVAATLQDVRYLTERTRAIANVVGVVLVVFILIAVPLRYLGGEPRLSETISPIHGFLYIVYLAATVDLSRRVGWSVWRTLGVMLAGTIPFLSFVVERRTTSALRPA